MRKLLQLVFIAVLAVCSSASFAEKTNSEQTNSQQNKSQPAVDVKTTELININQATIEQLSTLKGIGFVKAKAIVLFREEHGAFRSIDDLLKVKGIGEKVLAENEKYLTM